MMKTNFFPTDRAPNPKHGTLFAWPDRYASLEAAFADGCDVLGYLHGKGLMDQGTGTDKELHELFNMAMFRNGFWSVNGKPGAVDRDNLIICMVQTNGGYIAGEIQFLLAKIKAYKPRRKPALMGFSWGAWGVLGNVGNGTLDPREFSSFWLLSGGISGDRLTAFLAKMKGVDTEVYIVYNVNDTLVKYEPYHLWDKCYEGLKAQGNRCAYVRFKNVWTSSDGTRTSHNTTAWVFPGMWRMYNTDRAAILSANYAETFSQNAPLTYNVYEMIKRDSDIWNEVPGEPVPDPEPPADPDLPGDDILIHSLEITTRIAIIKKADGTLSHNVTNI